MVMVLLHDGRSCEHALPLVPLAVPVGSAEVRTMPAQNTAKVQVLLFFSACKLTLFKLLVGLHYKYTVSNKIGNCNFQLKSVLILFRTRDE